MKSKYNNQNIEIFENNLSQKNFLSMMNELIMIDTHEYDDNDKNEEEEEEEEDRFNKINYFMLSIHLKK